MDLGLGGRRYVVGGGSRGLGRAVADELVREGARVILLGRDADALAQAAGELGEAATPLSVDVTAADAGETVAAAVRDTFGGSLDGLLVNHGGPPIGPALDLTDEQWQQAFELCLAGPLRLLRALVPLMDEGGSIAFVTSTTIRQPMPGLDSSNVLRPGVAGLIKTLAHQLAPAIRVNGVAPGRFATERSVSLAEERAALEGISVDEQMAATAKSVPAGRYGDPAEFGRVGAFVLSPAASYMTGANVQVDGGLVVAIP